LSSGGIMNVKNSPNQNQHCPTFIFTRRSGAEY